MPVRILFSLLAEVFKFEFSCQLGLSGKSVILYAAVFTCRYLDLFTHFVSLYNSVMKIVYIVSTYLTLYLIYRKFKATYDRNHDTLRIEFLLLPSAALALLWNHEFWILEARFCSNNYEIL